MYILLLILFILLFIYTFGHLLKDMTQINYTYGFNAIKNSKGLIIN